MSNAQYLQYGCGFSSAKGWRNFDASPTLYFERLPVIGRLYTKNESRFPEGVEYGDIVRGLPVLAASCEAVYCSHILEHLSLQDFRTALRNTKNILRSGGVFRLVLPDLEYLARSYLDNASKEAAIDFMRETYLGHESRARGYKALISMWLGNSQHLWMWDIQSIQLELENAGFCDVRRAFFGDSSDMKFGEVEEISRWASCLGVECRKQS